jgi:hypothetical protein
MYRAGKSVAERRGEEIYLSHSHGSNLAKGRDPLQSFSDAILNERHHPLLPRQFAQTCRFRL